MRLVAYHRVSTARQGRSGLGLEAQETAINRLAAERNCEVIAAFTEVESGKVNNRPQLAEALHLAKITGATLAIAKLDRLSRNAAFLLILRDSGVRFIAADMPEANDITVGIMALVAQQEREAIAQRTREALRAAKARGPDSAIPTVPPPSDAPARAEARCAPPLPPTPTPSRHSSPRFSPTSEPEAARAFATSPANSTVAASSPAAAAAGMCRTYATFCAALGRRYELIAAVHV